ncbi:MAG: thiaminase II/PqqC family protein [Bdellovibrionota bacterium]
MSSPMPVLKRTAKIKSSDSDRVVVEHLAQEVILEGAGAELFTKIAPQLDGKSSIGMIAERAGEKPSRVEALTNLLKNAGIVSLLPADAASDNFSMTGVEYHALHRKYSSFWLQPVYEHPLWEKMITGKASRAQVIGFALEKYHYIEGAHEHMGVAAANATPEMMPHLARHFIEEYTHGDIYRKGLRSLFQDELVLNSQPLPSTRALINFLTETAARSSFAYYAGNEVLQMTENTNDEKASNSIDEFYAAMRKHYSYSNKLIDSFIQHTNADQNLGHSDVFMEMCESVPPLTRREVIDAMNVSRSMAEHLMLFMDGIETWYDKNESVPRVPCTLLSE